MCKISKDLKAYIISKVRTKLWLKIRKKNVRKPNLRFSLDFHLTFADVAVLVFMKLDAVFNKRIKSFVASFIFHHEVRAVFHIADLFKLLFTKLN